MTADWADPGKHPIRITFCELVVGTILGEAPPYTGEFTMTSGEGEHIAHVDKASGVLEIWTLAQIIGQTGPYAKAELWKNVYVAEESNPITIYYDYTAKGLVKAQGMALAGVSLEIYVEDSSGSRIWTKTLIDVDAEFGEVIPIDKSEAKFEDPVSVPSAGVYTMGVCLAGCSIVEGAGVGLVDFLVDGGVQVSLVIYPYVHTLSISASSGGTIEPSPGIHGYDHGTSVTVTATPNVGAHFVKYVLDGEDVYANDPYGVITITMDSDHTLHAVFQYPGVPGGDPGDPHDIPF